MKELSNQFDYVLGSKSPRRKDLLSQLGLSFTIRTSSFKEDDHSQLPASEVPEYFAKEKAYDLKPTLVENELLITADTDVILEGSILGKAKNKDEASIMLNNLSGKWHEVTTGMCLLTRKKESSFSETTRVKFKDLTRSEIEYYIEVYKPFDKAGAYGIQEWIGLIGVEKIEGCFFNVIGLPVPRFYKELTDFVQLHK